MNKPRPIFPPVYLLLIFVLLTYRSTTPTMAQPSQRISQIPPLPSGEFFCTGTDDLPQVQCEALVALYNSNPESTLAADGWLQRAMPCTWSGVSCNGNGIGLLNLPFKKLTHIPPEIGNLTGLHSLYLNNNALTTLPSTLGQLTKLGELHVEYNQLTQVPTTIGQLSQLRELQIHNNQLTQIPAEIGQLTNLNNLTLSDNRLTMLPPQLGNLSKLYSLHLADNALKALPAELGGMTWLHVLTLQNNQLTALPSTLGELPNLEELQLNNNRLTTLPATLGNLKQLTSLHLNDNQLTTLPSTIGQLDHLHWLLLRNNQLTDLPGELANLTGISSLVIAENPTLIGPVPKLLQQLHLTWFQYGQTNLCEPLEASFHTWLATIPVVQSTGISCATITTPVTTAAPGSYFDFTGANFPPNIPLTITVNGRGLDTIATSQTGNFTFTLSTAEANEGYYIVEANLRLGTDNVTIGDHFTLNTAAGLIGQPGNSLALNLPAGIAYTQFLYLPLFMQCQENGCYKPD